jgi:drug/metabolite transporter (DMT)-like permease
MSAPRNSAGTAGVAAVALASTIWGASFVLAKLALQELSVGQVILGRFVFAAVPLLPVLLLRRERVKRRDLPLFAVTGFLMVPVTFFLQFGGLSLTSATSAALIVATGTPLLALAAVFFERERLGPRGWSAVTLSTVGVAALVGPPGAGADFLGDLLVLSSIVVSVIWILTSKRLVGRYSAFYATGWIIVFGTAFLTPIVLVWEGVPTLQLSGITWTALIGLGLGCTVLAYTVWNWGVSRIGASRAAVWLNLEPMSGAFLAVALLGDALTAGILVGGLLILGAAWIISTAPPAPAPAPVQEAGPVLPAPVEPGMVRMLT